MPRPRACVPKPLTVGVLLFARGVPVSSPTPTPPHPHSFPNFMLVVVRGGRGREDKASSYLKRNSGQAQDKNLSSSL